MKPSEIRQLSDEEIKQRIKELEEELFNLRFQKALGQLEKPHRFKMIRKDIARMKTILREREIEREKTKSKVA
ncbi:LSU ribosomal protein L29P [Candidatus Thermokryptus mobilis]|jgi:large subunit ribosomal protein L29|uniref:Large ribosomal subunit protein uL29 n=1 Tax=Candidatus Thermokryptus mobilis TaxID=1643428 RepID=A0A0S4MS89_9BACT|nr:50S ribosomal protein L29 [Candidatus Thermokryptus mobilis]CUU01203.1 LSU ribosomal protein L29P [Candidatus Thermokryptus mobilis]